MWTAKKARGQKKEITSVSSRPVMFSNGSSEENLESTSSTSPQARFTYGSQYAPLDDVISPADITATALPPYQDDRTNVTQPQLSRRRRTGDTLRSMGSSVWSRTRDKVTNFNVPRLAAPWEHELTEKDEINGSPSDTVRDFDYRRQRRRLFLNSAFQWLITAGICVALVAVLYSYSNQTGLNQEQKHAFNALVTGLSILLGLNLASSLSGYAQMMRWRLLAAKYRNLQDFELVLNCDSQMKVVRLLWAGRTQGRWWIPNKTQLLCFTWLVINTALQVFTALLGLTYSVDTSVTYITPTWGQVSIADLSNIHIIPNLTESLFTNQAGDANTFGIEGQGFSLYSDVPASDQTLLESYYTNAAYSTYWYRFLDQNPNDDTETVVSPRTVSTTAYCDQFKVLSGGYANDDEDVTYFDTNLQQNVTQWVPLQGTGSGTWMSNEAKTCGPRCTSTFMLLAADNDTSSVPYPLWFSCNNTIGQVTNIDGYSEPAKYQMPDEPARAWAGSIGFSGISYTNSDPPLEYVLYDYTSVWSLNGYENNGTLNRTVAQYLMQFTAGGIAADDVNGQRINVPGYYPTQAQVVDVEWTWTIALLAGIPGCQFLVLLAVLAWANKVIIKDTSHLATARLLRPVVDKLGQKGCLLTGDEIAERLGNYRLKYGVRDPPQSSMAYSGLGGDFVRHVDVIEEVEGLGRADARMVNGLYDGTDSWNSQDDEREPLLRKRTTRRMSL